MKYDNGSLTLVITTKFTRTGVRTPAAPHKLGIVGVIDGNGNSLIDHENDDDRSDETHFELRLFHLNVCKEWPSQDGWVFVTG